jgi:hypothetical protein
LQPGIGLAGLAGDRNGHRFGYRDRTGCAARQNTGTVGAAPELGAVQIRPEAVGTLRQGESHLTTGICRSVVASVSGIGTCTRQGEGIHRQSGLGGTVCVLHRHRQWDSHRDICARAAWQAAGVVRAAPELGAIQIRPEAIVTLRQAEGDLPIGIRCCGVTGVGRAIACTRKGEGIHGQSGLGCASRIFHRHRQRVSYRDIRRRAAWQSVGVIGAAPELGAIEIRPEAVGTLWQGKRNLPVGICRSIVASISRPVEGINR